MDSPKDIWHFARPFLAKQYLGEFDLGLISARALFAKRRMGKSTFLERDLIPAAKQAGYMTGHPAGRNSDAGGRRGIDDGDARSRPREESRAALCRRTSRRHCRHLCGLGSFFSIADD